MSATLPRPFFAASGFTLVHGDCLKLLPSLAERSVDLVFADPPYKLSNGGFTAGTRRGGELQRRCVDKGGWDRSAGTEADFAFHLAWIEAVQRVLAPGGSLWISGTYHSIYQCGYALQLLGYRILNELIWFKPNAPPNLSGRAFAASHETLIWARRSPHVKHVFNYRLMKHGNWDSDFLKKPDKQMRSVWAIPATPPGERRLGRHPTQKPLALLRRIIIASSTPGATVLDPFAGSGTTGIAAAELGRRFIGIEQSHAYLELARRRYLATSGGDERGRVAA